MKRIIKNPPNTPWVRTDEPLMWLHGAGHEIIGPSDKYFFDARKRHDTHFVIQLTLRGAGFYERGGARTLIHPGMAFVDEMPSDFRYGYPQELTEEYEQVWVDVSGPVALDLSKHLKGSYGPVINLGAENPIATQMLSLAREHASGLHFDRYLLASQIYHLFMTIFSTLNATRQNASPLAANAIEIIHSRGLDDQYNVEAIANTLGCSREHLTRTFRSATGVGPGDYLLQHRLREAARQLRESREKLDLIAKRCGFSGANYFCRAFRKYAGMSPTDYRMQPWRGSKVNV